MAIDVLVFVTFLAEALPLALYYRHRQRLPESVGWLAGAFFVSWLMDVLSFQLNHFGQVTWWVGYFGYPVQALLLVSALLQGRSLRHVAWAGLALIAVTSALRGTLAQPETFVRVSGGAVACFLIWGNTRLHRFQFPVWVLCGATIPSVLAMGYLSFNDPAWMRSWTTYQILRLVGLSLFTWALVGRGTYGSREHRHEVDGEHGTLLSRVGGDHLPQAAKR